MRILLLLLSLFLPTSLPATSDIPLSQIPLADPYILLEGNYYYAYGTHSNDGIEVWRSTDLAQWECLGLALHKQHTSETRWFWAPEVYRKGDTYYMYYSANEHLYVATATSPTGPFWQKGGYQMKSLLGDEKCIDSHVFFDEDGTAWLFFVRFTDGNCIWTCQLSDDLITPIAATLSPCISVSQPWEQAMGRVVEGPYMAVHNGRYYLTYSANDFRSPQYGIGYATASSPRGPWTKYPHNPILQHVNGLVGTGHHSIFTDKHGHLRLVFHAHHDASHVQPRLMYITDIRFRGKRLEWPNAPILSPSKLGE